MEDIKELLDEPFEYGSEEYMKVMKKILKNREKYRMEQEQKKKTSYVLMKKIKNNRNK